LAGQASPRRSQVDRILALLADGDWWTTGQLLANVPCIVHSRIAELRSRGHVIVHERTGFGAAGHRYRLLGEPCPTASLGGDPVAARSVSLEGGAAVEAAGASPPSEPEQLTLAVA